MKAHEEVNRPDDRNTPEEMGKRANFIAWLNLSGKEVCMTDDEGDPIPELNGEILPTFDEVATRIPCRFVDGELIEYEAEAPLEWYHIQEIVLQYMKERG
jgi:hypothetical protein